MNNLTFLVAHDKKIKEFSVNYLSYLYYMFLIEVFEEGFYIFFSFEVIYI